MTSKTTQNEVAYEFKEITLGEYLDMLRKNLDMQLLYFADNILVSVNGVPTQEWVLQSPPEALKPAFEAWTGSISKKVTTS